MNTQELKNALQNGRLDDALLRLYGREKLPYARQRCLETIDGYTALFGEQPELHLFSSPGRVEIAGNHTDHNHGEVLAGAVNMDILAAVAPASDNVIRVKSIGHKQDDIDLSDLSPQAEEATHSASLIRGIACDFAKKGRKTGGLTAFTTSDVPKGSGLSSSAAFEVLIGCMLSHFYNGGAVPPEQIAISAQFAENAYYGKPSGLMDQMACSVGSIVHIDFADPSAPQIEPIALDLEKLAYRLVIVDVHGNHADLTDAYAAIPAEMKAVAAVFGQETLRGLSYEQLLERAQEIREKCGDRALLRAIHFVGENDRVRKAAAALQSGDFPAFCAQLTASGRSSVLCLQNIYPPAALQSQGVTLGLAVAERVLNGEGAFRVHGGGFGGTTFNLVPESRMDQFRRQMELVFGEGCCHPLTFREGAAQIV